MSERINELDKLVWVRSELTIPDTDRAPIAISSSPSSSSSPSTVMSSVNRIYTDEVSVRM